MRRRLNQQRADSGVIQCRLNLYLLEISVRTRSSASLQPTCICRDALLRVRLDKDAMLNRFKIFCLLAVMLVTAIAAAQDAPVTLRPQGMPDYWGNNYQWTVVADGFDNPVGLSYPPDDSGRVFVIEQGGMIWSIAPDGSVPFDPFLDISREMPPAVFRGGYSEQGLLGLAFHPDYAENGWFYVSYTNRDGDSILSRFTVSDDPEVADEDSETQRLFIDQPFDNHNGGGLAFGPDGYLYASFGDGGSQGDPNGNAQNPLSRLGKILRLDVNTDSPYAAPANNPYADQPDLAPEVWAIGFRNPWRFSFDRATGDLYIADVGEWQWEEINFQPADSTGGENYGWNLFESRLPRTDDADSDDFTAPIAEYSHNDGCSVTGGYVYRGEALPDLHGVYLFGDYCVGRMWASFRDGDGVWQTVIFMETSLQITSFGEDQAGELYLVDYKGAIWRLS